jgi:hypothetical protein
MTTTWNNTAPAMGNQVSADIPDITENFAHIKSGLVRIFQTAWSDSDLSAHVIDSGVGFSDGTYTYDFPTNPAIAANSIIMLGNSDTVVWMYLNTAPPGWKALATGADMVLAIAGGSGDYNVNGGNPDTSNTWTIDGLSAANEGSHTHAISITSGAPSATDGMDVSEGAAADYGTETHTHSVSGTSGGGSNHSHTITQDASWRPKASVGKLFQLDTA